MNMLVACFLLSLISVGASVDPEANETMQLEEHLGNATDAQRELSWCNHKWHPNQINGKMCAIYSPNLNAYLRSSSSSLTGATSYTKPGPEMFEITTASAWTDPSDANVKPLISIKTHQKNYVGWRETPHSYWDWSKWQFLWRYTYSMAMGTSATHITENWEVINDGKDYANCPNWSPFGLKAYTRGVYLSLTGGHNGAGTSLVGHMSTNEKFEFRHCGPITFSYSHTHKIGALCSNTQASVTTVFIGEKCNDNGSILWQSMQTINPNNVGGTVAGCQWSRAANGPGIISYLGTCGQVPSAVPGLPTNMNQL